MALLRPVHSSGLFHLAMGLQTARGWGSTLFRDKLREAGHLENMARVSMNYCEELNSENTCPVGTLPLILSDTGLEPVRCFLPLVHG